MCSKCNDFWCELDEDGEHFDNYPQDEDEGNGWGCLLTLALIVAGLLLVGCSTPDWQESHRKQLSQIELAERAAQATRTVEEQNQKHVQLIEQKAKQHEHKLTRIDQLAGLETALAAFWMSFPAALATMALGGGGLIMAGVVGAYRMKRREHELVTADRRGLVPIPRTTVERDPRAALELLAIWHERQRTVNLAGAQRISVPQTLNYSPTYAPHEATQITSESTALPEPPSAPIPPILDLLAKLRKPHLLINGETGAGKTTLVQWIVKERLGRADDLLIIDPHHEPGNWPENVKVIGGGENWQAIHEALTMLKEQMVKRFEAVNNKEARYSDYRRLTIYIGEWPGISDELGKDAGRLLSALVCRSRKIGYRLVVDGQSATVDSMGLKGRGDMRKNLARIELAINEHNERVVELDGQNCRLMGSFTGWGALKPVLEPPRTAPEPPRTTPEPQPEPPRTASEPQSEPPTTGGLELTAEETVRLMRARGKDEQEITKHLAITFRDISRTMVAKMVKLSKQEALRIAKEARQAI